MSFKDLVEINRKIRESEAYQRVQRIDDLMPSVRVFEGNHLELHRCIHACERDWKITDIRRRQELWDLLHEFSRCLFNFTASAKGLVDHTRRFVDAHLNDRETPDLVQAEIDRRFKHDELTAFVHNLRDFMLHREIPDVVLGERKMVSDGEFHALQFMTKDLLAFKKWSPLAKAFINRSGEAIQVSKLFTLYFQNVMEFQQWLRDRAFEYHRNDLEEIRTLEEAAIPHRREFTIQVLEELLRDVEQGHADPFDLMAHHLEPEVYRALLGEEHPGIRFQRAIAHMEARGRFELPLELKERLAILADSTFE